MIKILKDMLRFIFAVLPLLIYMDYVLDIVFIRDFNNLSIIGFTVCLTFFSWATRKVQK